MLQFLAVDAHSPLVTLGNAHLIAAALHFLTGVLGGVQTYARNETRNKDLRKSKGRQSPKDVSVGGKDTEKNVLCNVHLHPLSFSHCLVKT